jgi:hypothetical protein
MSTIAALVVLAMLFIFGVVIYLMINSSRRASEKKRQISGSLGFNTLEADAELLERISHLYRRGDRKRTFELRDVSRKSMPDGELVIFDLVETSGEDDSYPEQQAVAVISDHLDLPEFLIFPKAGTEGAAADLANRLLGWVLSKFDTPVEFPEVPEFQRRYIVTSPEPENTRRFLSQTVLRRLAQISYLTIHAYGNIFILNSIERAGKPHTYDAVSERVKQALDVYVVFSSYGAPTHPGMDEDNRGGD